jgi:hypothetical protein
LEPHELTSGLWRWTAPHPEWRPGASGSADDWPREVGCALFQTSAVTLFVDPQLPGDEKAFWQWADERCKGRQVAVLTTVAYHRRSRDAVIERYGAASYSPDAAEGEREQILPGGVICFPLEPLGETIVWLVDAQTLITGDSIIGSGGGKLRLCPESWLGDAPEPVTLDELRLELRELLSLPIERVLVSHGEPALERAHSALVKALEPLPAAERLAS